MRIKLIKGSYAFIPKTLGIVFQERLYYRICLVWWHVIIDLNSYKSHLTQRAADGFRAVPNSNLEVSETPSAKAVEIRRHR